jgi:hypothetical protein
MVYRIAHHFVRVEALGNVGQAGRINDPQDPITLEVRVTDADDLTKIIETVDISSNLKNKPFRLSTGVWGFDLNPGLYSPGKKYVAHFRYTMTPNNLKVDRLPFTWDPVPEFARLPTHCVVYGMLGDIAGNPISNFEITVEQYKDALTLNHRLGAITTISDIFGNWFIEVERGTLLRFVYGELEKIVVVPQLGRAQLSQIPPWQPADVRKDRFGYPLP